MLVNLCHRPHQFERKRLLLIGFALFGLATLSVGFLLVPTLGAPRAIPVQAAGGIISALGAYLFIYNLWRTIDGLAPVPVRATDALAVARRLPLAD